VEEDPEEEGEGEVMKSPLLLDEISAWGAANRSPVVPPEPVTLDAIAAEVTRARLKFPGNRHMLAALTEEVGELAQALLQGKSRAEVVAEAIQVACVAVRIIEEGDASFAALTDEERQA
jgi:hypothetical protein